MSTFTGTPDDDVVRTQRHSFSRRTSHGRPIRQLFVGFLGVLSVQLTVLPAHAQTCLPPPAGLIGWWDGDAVSGTSVTDLQGNFNGTLQGRATTSPGQVGQAFSFDGSVGTGVRIPSSSQLNVGAITLDAWIKPFSFPNAFPTIMRRHTSTGVQYLIAATDGGRAHCNIAAFGNPVGGSVPLNQWSHIACTYDRQAVRLYVDGAEVSTFPTTQSIPSSTRDLWIGRWEFSDPAREFNGLIDEVELFNRALSASEVQAIFDAGPAGKCKDDDGDGIRSDLDNCPAVANPDQVDTDGDGAGDACDLCALDADNDADQDGVCGNLDNCPALTNADQVDTDSDGVGDACDICPLDADNDADQDGICGDLDNCPAMANANQADVDGDGLGDACDPDSDNDGVDDVVDNCTFDANPDQADADRDDAGDACDADDDNDGVIDADDACMPTPAGEQVDATGCSIAQLCPCENEWKNHGAYVSCVAHAAEDFVDLGLISEAEKDAILSAAGQSQCGDKK